MNPNASITGMKNAQQADKVNTPRGHHIKVTDKESPAHIRKKDTMLLGKPSFAMDLPTTIAPRNR